MHTSEVLTCVSTTPLLRTILQCDPINVAVNVPAPTTDWPGIITAAVIGVIGALFGSTVGARMAIKHSERLRAEDQTRHLRERVAELIFRVDGVVRALERYYQDFQTGRAPVMQGGKEVDITVSKPPASVLDEAQAAKDDASAILGYLGLTAPGKISDLAEKAATKAGMLKLLMDGAFPESEYRHRFAEYESARAELKKEISPARSR
jgi:hypothetical protein